MAYQDDPGVSTREAVRFWLQDTGAQPLLSDNELDYLTTYVAGYTADPLLIAAVACTVVASKYARVTTISIDGGSISGADLAVKMGQLADTLRAEYTRLNGSSGTPFAGGVEIYDFSRYGARPPMFAIGQNDYPGLGYPSSVEQYEQYNDGVLDGQIYPGG